MDKRIYLESGLKGLVPVNERNQKAVDYQSCSLIYNLQRYEDNVASDLKQMLKNDHHPDKEPGIQLTGFDFRHYLFERAQASLSLLTKQ